ncbi:DUF1674 domain-containing protein [Pseudoxanthomonas wuyuanensis]|uniref:DUF1674 domain-containing protein n=1 Tax=Pseudoxanthomonas wuyuanensis TaxID=1073196 RepID=UPI000BE374B3|nr:DUF1674 domain-containing protein [Pseudoxanthomonas wuyuanensis]
MIGQTPSIPDSGSETQLSNGEVLPVPTVRKEKAPAEIGGRVGPEPTRYGDWEKNGRCIDF